MAAWKTPPPALIETPLQGQNKNRNDNLRITCNVQPVLANIDRALRLPLDAKEMFFLWGPRQAGKRIRDDHLKGLRELVKDHPEVKMRILVGLEPGKGLTPDGIWILHAEEFTKMLWRGEIF